MALRWSNEPPEPVGRLGGTEELRRVVRSTRLAAGTLACPECDAPVAPDGWRCTCVRARRA